jgi:D-alanyl-D-alanine carboxypeptidase/D-alanyl-D-alanine-endopeptidase (penicillin-binding protein 4)
VRLTFFILILLGCSALMAAKTLPAETDFALLNPPPHSQWGYSVMDVKTKASLTENGGHRFLIPASVVKLLTTAFILDKMNSSRRFPTVLYRTGKIENGVLRGDLWIRGGGNPALGSERGDSSQRIEAVFGLFLHALQQAGIHEVDGNIHGDGSLIEPEGPAQGALWEDIGNYYGAVPSGLCFHDNSYILQLATTGNGPSLSIQDVFPRHIGVSRFQISAQNSGTLGDSCFILGAFWNTPRLIAGSCPVGKKPLAIKGSLPDPAWTCARNFEDFLREHDVTLKSFGGDRSDDPLPAPDSLPADTARVGEHLSPELMDLIADLLNSSDNLYATELMVLAGMESGMQPNTRGGLEAFHLWLDGQGIPNLASEAHLVDGNGLSLHDQLTTAFLAQQLSTFASKPWFDAWRQTLLPATSRLLKTSGVPSGLQGKLWTKTGSMTGISSLAGYLETRSGRLLAFAIVVNHFDETASTVRNRWEPLLRAWQERY